MNSYELDEINTTMLRGHRLIFRVQTSVVRCLNFEGRHRRRVEICLGILPIQLLGRTGVKADI